MPSWGSRGSLLERSCALLGSSWGPLGAVWGHLWASLRPQEPIGGKQARKHTTLMLLRFWKDFGLLGGGP
eukprot:1765904-Pyramimonas_sp.AAC.1